MKRETLALDTPARSATSSMVTRLRWAVEKSFTAFFFLSETGFRKHHFRWLRQVKTWLLVKG
jgi:hypothetical protein